MSRFSRLRRRAAKRNREIDPEAARALMEAAPQLGPRSARADTKAEGARVDYVEAEPIANGGDCEGRRCNMGRPGTPRRAVFGLFGKSLCDRCATRYAQDLDGHGAMATKLKTRRPRRQKRATHRS